MSIDSSFPSPPSIPPNELRKQLHSALLDWFQEISKTRCVVVAADDFHRIDEPSAAFFALLSNRVFQERVLVAVTYETYASATSKTALSFLLKTGTSISLEQLSLEDTETLLRSVFGDAPNIRLLTDRIYEICDGSPQAIMQLAQHLLDKAIIRYEVGTWILPISIKDVKLPQSITEARRLRIQLLRDSALDLAQTMALSSIQSLSFDDCFFLAGHGIKAQLINDLDQLVAFGILCKDGASYSLIQSGWRAALIVNPLFHYPQH